MTLPWPAAAWRGQGLVEYGLILGLTALFTVVILVVFGGTLADVLDAIGDARHKVLAKGIRDVNGCRVPGSRRV